MWLDDRHFDFDFGCFHFGCLFSKSIVDGRVFQWLNGWCPIVVEVLISIFCQFCIENDGRQMPDLKKRNRSTALCYQSREAGEKRVLNNLCEWKRKLCLPGVDNHSWLQVLPKDGNGIRLVCGPCAKYYSQRKLETTKGTLWHCEGKPVNQWTRLGPLKLHSNGNNHQLAVSEWIRDNHLEISQKKVTSITQDFKTIIEEAKKGSQRKLAFAARRKKRWMKYCVAESWRARKRTFFKEAKACAIHHDGSGARLFTRFGLCSKDHCRQEGFLHMVDSVKEFKSQDGIALAKSIVLCVKRACTELSKAPGKS